MSKGSRNRTKDAKRYGANYDRIDWAKKKKNDNARCTAAKREV